MKLVRIFCGVLLLTFGLSAASGQDRPLLQPRDVVAVLGGARMVALEKGGYAESLVATARPSDQLRWRGLAWEGDTVFSRPREVNYPTHRLTAQESGIRARPSIFFALLRRSAE